MTELDPTRFYENFSEEYLCYQLDEHSPQAINLVFRDMRSRIRSDFDRYRASGEPLYVRYMVGVEPGAHEALSVLEQRLMNAIPLDARTLTRPAEDELKNAVNMLLAASFRAQYPDGRDGREYARMMFCISKRTLCGTPMFEDKKF